MCLVLALAAVVSCQEAPKKVEKRGIVGGIGLPLGTIGLGGIPLGLSAPIAPLGLGYGYGSPLVSNHQYFATKVATFLGLLYCKTGNYYSF